MMYANVNNYNFVRISFTIKNFEYLFKVNYYDNANVKFSQSI